MGTHTPNSCECSAFHHSNAVTNLDATAAIAHCNGLSGSLFFDSKCGANESESAGGSSIIHHLVRSFCQSTAIDTTRRYCTVPSSSSISYMLSFECVFFLFLNNLFTDAPFDIGRQFFKDLSKVNVWSFTFHCCIIKLSSRVYSFFKKKKKKKDALLCVRQSLRPERRASIVVWTGRVTHESYSLSLFLCLSSACRKSWEDLTYCDVRARLPTLSRKRTNGRTNDPERLGESRGTLLIVECAAVSHSSTRFEKSSARERKEIFYFAFLAASYCERGGRRRSPSRRCTVPCIHL